MKTILILALLMNLAFGQTTPVGGVDMVVLAAPYMHIHGRAAGLFNELAKTWKECTQTEKDFTTLKGLADSYVKASLADCLRLAGVTDPTQCDCNEAKKLPLNKCIFKRKARKALHAIINHEDDLTLYLRLQERLSETESKNVIQTLKEIEASFKKKK